MAQTEIDEICFCLRCGHRLVQEQRFGRLRPVCLDCGYIHFFDPKVAVAALIIQDGKVLLVRRANDPLRGLWTLPAGFVDADENPVVAIVRECREETGLDVRVTGLLDVLYGREHPRGADILIAYRAEVISGTLTAADDVDGSGFFALDELPPLAFQTTTILLSTLK